jgi:hypothetical protein
MIVVDFVSQKFVVQFKVRAWQIGRQKRGGFDLREFIHMTSAIDARESTTALSGRQRRAAPLLQP